jgi:thiamine pyrophosphate-dependent acetolactate synthase large subunit-like protein
MANHLQRTEVARTLMEQVGDELIVCGLGSPVSDVSSARDRDLNFYLVGAMGSATPTGLGLALAQPDRAVVVVTGDAELMMNIGILATIGIKQPRNLSILVFDNERFGETGQQVSHTAYGIDIAGIAAACRFPHTMLVRQSHELGTALALTHAMTGPHLAVIKVDPERVPISIPIKDGVLCKGRFRKALLGTY